jgi:hypothetical protein
MHGCQMLVLQDNPARLLPLPAAAQVGWLTAKVNRRLLLFAVVMLGQAPCLLTYWVSGPALPGPWLPKRPGCQPLLAAAA